MDFATHLMSNPMLLAELHHGVAAGTSKLGFEAAGLVIDAGVNDAAVVAGLR